MLSQTVPHVHEIAEALQRDLAATPRRNFIGGAWVEAASGRTFDVLNPATGAVLARCADSDAEDVDRAVKAARAAFAVRSRRGTFRFKWRRGSWRRRLPPVAQSCSSPLSRPRSAPSVSSSCARRREFPRA